MAFVVGGNSSSTVHIGSGTLYLLSEERDIRVNGSEGIVVRDAPGEAPILQIEGDVAAYFDALPKDVRHAAAIYAARDGVDIDIGQDALIFAASAAPSVAPVAVSLLGPVTLSNAGDVRSSAVGISLLGSDSHIHNDGRIQGATVGIQVMAGSEDSLIANAGLIRGTQGIVLATAGAELNNAGTIEGTTTAILTSTEDARITNTGHITALSGENSALHLGGSFTLHNHGTITNGITYQGAGPGLGAMVNTGILTGQNIAYQAMHGGTGLQTTALINSGIITAPTALHLNGHGDRVESTGTITGDILLDRISTDTGADTLINSGTLHGDISAFGGDDSITNTGTVWGAIDLGAGQDVFDGRGGQVRGTVSGGTGDDTYHIDATSGGLLELEDGGFDTVVIYADHTLQDHFEDLIMGGTDDLSAIANGLGNTLTGNMGDNWLRGKAGKDDLQGAHGNDTLKGGGGKDTLFGGAGEDLLRGGDDSDTLGGGDDNDTLYGGGSRDFLKGDGGDDWLSGGKNIDRLNGGDGDDTLLGGSWGDFLTGGEGEDVFVYTRVKDSAIGHADTILDFTPGEDLIDLRDLSEDVFAFSAAGLTGGGTISVHLLLSEGTTTVMLDVTGDGTAEMAIVVQNVAGLTATDFLL